MRRNIIVTVIILLLSGMIFYNAPIKSQPSISNEVNTSDECRLAISIAEAFLPKAREKPSDLKLIETKNLLISGSDCCNPHIWRLTFLDKSLIDEKGLRGKGGQLYIEVNVQTKEAKVLGHGE
ncbi:MAG: hypothetical protein M3209_00360 [Acidobacteriota bacterium]|nr:hypothetical protein [Acidobacteriota bacterium]